MPVKVLAAMALAIAVLALTAAASTAGAARGVQHHLLGLAPHAAHTGKLASAKRASKAAALNCISDCSLYETTINQYFTDIAHDSGLMNSVYGVATQYSSIQYSQTFNAATNVYVDGNPYPATKSNNCHDGFDKYCVTDGQLETEIAKVIKQKRWPSFSMTALYFIFTPANVGVCEFPGSAGNTRPCTTNAFCAYHSAFGLGVRPKFIYAVEPDAAAAKGGGCSTHQAPAGNSADATISTVSHEQNEAITDPLGDGWIANDGPAGTPQDENGDLCAYDFGTPLGTTLGGAQYNQVINGHDYFLQLEYSNQDGGCVPYLGGPVTAPNPQLQDGTGPLVLQSPTGSVMATNTVYAIYWVAAAPVNSHRPTISGTAKVGKKLKASHGTWSNAPKFTYRWRRCSSKGTSCRNIAGATAVAHPLVKADKGHRLEVRVTAKNAMGSVSALSAPSALVTK